MKLLCKPLSVFCVLVCLFTGLSAQDSLNVTLLGQIYQSGGSGTYGNLAVRNGVAYICNSDAGLQFIDISNPHNPQIIGNCYYYEQANDIFLYGNYAYVAAHYQTPPDGDWVSNELIYNISNLSNVQSIGGMWTEAETAGAFVVNNKAYVADWSDGIKIFNVSYPNSPQLLCSYDTPGYVGQVEVAGSYIYVADGSGGFRILSYTAPNTIQEIGSLPFTGRITDVKVRDNHAYLLENRYSPNGSYVHIVNVADPANPLVEGTFTIENCSWEIAVSGSYVCVTTYVAGFRIIDFSNPAAPQETGFYVTPGYTFGVAIEGNLAYVCNGNGQYFNVFDISQAVPNCDDTTSIPAVNTLQQNSPNPFHLETGISFTLSKSGMVNLSIFDVKGRLVKQLVNMHQKQGEYQVAWDGTDISDKRVAAGVYFYKMVTDNGTHVRKCLLLR